MKWNVFLLITAFSFNLQAKNKRLDSVSCTLKQQAYGDVLDCGEDLYSVKMGSSVEKSLNQICKKNFKCQISFEVNGRDEVTKVLSAFSKGHKQAKTYETSFDCRKAKGFAEKTVCEDKELANLDNQLGAKLKRALEVNVDTKKIRDDQRDWVREVRNHCQNSECLLKAYQKRLKNFKFKTDSTL